ncbi:hypothetical protein DCC79_08445 [bacterium]|nr:MAG: hypothetical protein DCC79_08445 [bacterium]
MGECIRRESLASQLLDQPRLADAARPHNGQQLSVGEQPLELVKEPVASDERADRATEVGAAIRTPRCPAPLPSSDVRLESAQPVRQEGEATEMDATVNLSNVDACVPCDRLDRQRRLRDITKEQAAPGFTVRVVGSEVLGQRGGCRHGRTVRRPSPPRGTRRIELLVNRPLQDLA